MSNIVNSAKRDRIAHPLAIVSRQFGRDYARLTVQSWQLIAEGRGDRDFVELVEDPLSFPRLSAPPRGDVGYEQVLVEQTPRKHGQERQKRARLDEPGAWHVLDRDSAVPYRFEETRHTDAGGRVQLERIAPVCVNMAPDDIALLQAGDRTDKDAPVAHDEIFAFHQQKAEIARQIGLLEIG